MKPLYIFLSFLSFLTVQSYSQEPTDAGIPDANHVLVVYNSNSSVSDSVKNYYRDARNIPASNIVPLPLPVYQDITIDGSTHRVKIVQATDIIQDSVNNANNLATPTRHAWKYFLDNISTPIKNWISSHNLTSIRYVVLIKGVPCKIQGGANGSDDSGNLTVGGMLCLLNTENYDTLIMNEVYPNGGVPNPYFAVDPDFTMDYRFIPDHFTTTWHGYLVKLSYLVSHLDGISYDIV